NFGLPPSPIGENQNTFEIETIEQMQGAHILYILTTREPSNALELLLSEACDVVRAPMICFIQNSKPFKLDVSTWVTMYKLTEPEKPIRKLFQKPFGVTTEL